MLDCKTLDHSLYAAYKAGKISLPEAARKFYTHGWTNFVDEDYARRVFNRIAMEEQL